ncbi:MAG: hypothetical protein K2P93_03750 [Alphaproteobacteria bacterium]|nr:hypothetical protein [Alphaproteobacteria bacterium]
MSYAFYVFWFTVKQSILSVLFTVPIGGLIARALVWNHTWLPARLCLKVLGLPFITPALVGILGFIALFSAFFNVYSLSGIIMAHVVFFSPFVAHYMINAWRFIPEEHYRLASQLHFSSAHILYFVELPQLRKALLEVSWICFCLFLNSFTLIMVLGGGPQKTTLSMAIYQSLFFFYDPEEGFKFGSLQFLLTLSLIFLTCLFKVRPSGKSLKTPSFPPLTAPFQRPLVWAALLLIFSPIVAVIFPSFKAAPMALQNPLLWQSLGASLSTSIWVGPLSVLLAMALVSTQSVFGKPLATLYFLLPPTLIGTLLFFLSLKTPYIPSTFFLGVMQILYILPFSYSLLVSPHRSVKETYGPIALSLGLSRLQSFLLVEWPLLKKPIATALGMSCALSIGNFASLAFFENSGAPGLTKLLYEQMGRHFNEGMVTAFLLLIFCYFLYQLPQWILKTHDRTASA